MRDVAPVIASWPRVRWFGRGPMQWWWATPLAATVAWVAVSLAIGNADIALGGGAGSLVVGLALAYRRYKGWVADATGPLPPRAG